MLPGTSTICKLVPGRVALLACRDVWLCTSLPATSWAYSTVLPGTSSIENYKMQYPLSVRSSLLANDEEYNCLPLIEWVEPDIQDLIFTSGKSENHGQIPNITVITGWLPITRHYHCTMTSWFKNGAAEWSVFLSRIYKIWTEGPFWTFFFESDSRKRFLKKSNFLTAQFFPFIRV